ncbi:hypothetical protein [Sunxiuqinia elliptica]|uniref:tRNA (Guanine-N1)-methyltransferase n=1 Tax=Sunxiuqinia elliptica TaxID=655355 RepID=A0A4R6H6D9_9BACT|nr:hypothetical protein [Sunxiuqinia elliptica]TDO03066.1 hypothetical protein DET52_1031 [Sunxiuqinia elliptica]TDO59265.1 hypothetical protein DET65_2544 [Sunxiuqinia elliptica]
MKRALSKYLFFCLFLTVSSGLSAQTTSFKSAFDTLSIQEQFDFLYKRSNTYEQYKVMSISGYMDLKANLIDSVSMYQQDANSHIQEINTLKENLIATNTQIEKLEKELNDTKNSKDSMSLLGIEVSKASYNAIMWGLIIGLAVVALVLFSLYKRGHQVVKETKTRLGEVQEDLESLRKNALVREQKLARELMDYKLKHKPNR